MKTVIEFDLEADTRNFALMHSLYTSVDIFSVLQKYRRNVCVLLNSQPGGEHSMLHVLHDNQTKGANF